MEGKDYVMANGDVVEGNRAGQHSIRVNDQWRICLTWNAGVADGVELVDYH